MTWLLISVVCPPFIDPWNVLKKYLSDKGITPVDIVTLEGELYSLLLARSCHFSVIQLMG